MQFKETDKFRLSLIDNAYFQVEVKEDAEFEVKDMEQLVQSEKELCNKILPVLVLCAPTASSSDEFVKYLSKNINNPLCKADAFVLSSIAQKILAHFHKLFNKHERPTAFFTNKEEALKWLSQYFD